MTLYSRARYWLLPLPLLALLALTYWLDRQAQPESYGSDSSKRHDPDAIVDNFSATRLNEQGTPHTVITAKRMLHFPDDDSATLEMPRVSSFSAERPAIRASAEQGTLSKKEDEVFLRGDVKILRESGPNSDGFSVQTEYLHIIPERDLVKTNRSVKFVDAHSTITAVGLEMDNKARTLKLLSQVKGEYVSSKK